MSGHTFSDDDLLTADDINQYIGTTYEYAYNGISSFVPTPANAWNNFSGQISVTIEVTATGILWCEWGFEGWIDVSANDSIWAVPYLTGANDVSPSLEHAARVTTKGHQGPRSTSRQYLFTGLTPGATTVTMLGRVSAATSPALGTENFIDNQWLYVQNFR